MQSEPEYNKKLDKLSEEAKDVLENYSIDDIKEIRECVTMDSYSKDNFQDLIIVLKNEKTHLWTSTSCIEVVYELCSEDLSSSKMFIFSKCYLLANIFF